MFYAPDCIRMCYYDHYAYHAACAVIDAACFIVDGQVPYFALWSLHLSIWKYLLLILPLFFPCFVYRFHPHHLLVRRSAWKVAANCIAALAKDSNGYINVGFNAPSQVSQTTPKRRHPRDGQPQYANNRHLIQCPASKPSFHKHL